MTHFETAEQAAEAGVMGWNQRCQRCGTFGALWVQHLLPGRNQVRLCSSCRDAADDLWRRVVDFYTVKYPAGDAKTRWQRRLRRQEP